MNSVVLIGRLTKDPVVSYTSATNTAVAVFTLAIDRPTSEKRTDFPRVRVFGKQAENVEKYVHKGSLVGVQGGLETGSYEKDGKTVYYTDVIANRVEFISNSKKDGETSKETPSRAREEQQEYDGFEAVDDDLPF